MKFHDATDLKAIICDVMSKNVARNAQDSNGKGLAATTGLWEQAGEPARSAARKGET
ncbi:MAG: hypothetical protein WC076_11865 [Terrimicrobiaceae bacterium]|nr:hypothetical protein [Terrimicrobiaceae bacterium]